MSLNKVDPIWYLWSVELDGTGHLARHVTFVLLLVVAKKTAAVTVDITHPDDSRKFLLVLGVSVPWIIYFLHWYLSEPVLRLCNFLKLSRCESFLLSAGVVCTLQYRLKNWVDGVSEFKVFQMDAIFVHLSRLRSQV